MIPADMHYSVLGGKQSQFPTWSEGRWAKTDLSLKPCGLCALCGRNPWEKPAVFRNDLWGVQGKCCPEFSFPSAPLHQSQITPECCVPGAPEAPLGSLRGGPGQQRSSPAAGGPPPGTHKTPGGRGNTWEPLGLAASRPSGHVATRICVLC